MRIREGLKVGDFFFYLILKSYKATGNITPTPIHIQLNELKKSFF